MVILDNSALTDMSNMEIKQSRRIRYLPHKRRRRIRHLFSMAALFAHTNEPICTN
jgi:hypothetical protein